jgi:hypothetical protein
MLALQWKNADLLQAAIPISGRETVLNTVEIPGQEAVTLPPVCLAYSPEFAPDQPGRGLATLAQISRTSNGAERIEIPRIWSELASRPRYIEIAPWLMVLAVLLFLLEIFERRTGWLTRLLSPKAAFAPATVASAEPEPAAGRARKPRRAAPIPGNTPTVSSDTAASQPSPASPTDTPSSESGIDALREARDRATRRTKRD